MLLISLTILLPVGALRESPVSLQTPLRKHPAITSLEKRETPVKGSPPGDTAQSCFFSWDHWCEMVLKNREAGRDSGSQENCAIIEEVV